MALLISSQSHAALTIEITGGGSHQIPIAIPVFGLTTADNPSNIQNISQIINADLRSTGLFRLLETTGVANHPTNLSDIRYADWASIQAQALVAGNIQSQPGNRLKVTFNLVDVFKQTQLLGMEYNITPSQQRAIAHKIADAIYQKLTGEIGNFSSRIAYITKLGKHYILYVADADGHNAQVAAESNEPIISPAWSPDGTKLAYVSFERKKPIIFVQSLMSGKRNIVANFKGNNSAPSWSPDGTKLAIVLTYSGDSQLYVIDADGSGLRQVTKSNGIDTEPTWSPDAQWIYFTSDRGGRPQIYKAPTSGGAVQRVTYEGGYNVSARVSPDGKLLAYIRLEAGKFRVALQDLATGQVQLLSEGPQDESPSFSPNGRFILYATRAGLAMVSVDGKVRQRLSESNGSVREPAWGSTLN